VPGPRGSDRPTGGREAALAQPECGICGEVSGRGIDGDDLGPTRSMTAEEPPVPVDVSGLSGFSYACRPGCGLCCYAEPLVTPAEKPPLLRIVPSVELVSRGRFEFLGSHAEGGACRLLEGNRCRAHAARPSPCREFPLTAHVGVRLQATVVLTCPGVDLAALRGYQGPDGATPPHGFETELAALRSRANRSVLRRIEVSERRRRRIARVLTEEGRWNEEEEVRGRLRNQIPIPTVDDFPAEDPPPLEEGLESLPLVFDGRAGPVAFAGDSGAWELFELRPTGGVARSLGIAAPPDHPPAVTEDAARTLAGYLRYWLERDVLFGTVHLAMLEGGDGSVTDHIVEELQRIAAVTLSRAYVLAALRRGNVNRLTEEDVRDGLRATDQDLLDRASWGERL